MTNISNAICGVPEKSTNPQVVVPIGVRVDRSNWYFDVFEGKATALVAAGLVTPAQLLPQKGRKIGRGVFNPDGTPFPAGRSGGWREPGYKVVLEIGDDRYRIEVTVSAEEQGTRRKLQRAQREKAAELEIRNEAATKREMLRSRPLRHEFGPFAERWEGTQEQMQAAGVGLGVEFPAAGKRRAIVLGSCSLGFQVQIALSHNRVEAAAGIYHAYSYYVEEMATGRREVSTSVPYAPGVEQVFTRCGDRINTFVGTAEALSACGLARPDQFPGQPGRGKVRCSYRADGSMSNTSSFGQCALTIGRQGKHRFFVEVPVSESVQKLRKAKRKAEEESLQLRASKARAERIAAREGEKYLKIGRGAIEQYREKIVNDVEIGLRMVWAGLNQAAAGPFSVSITEGDDAYEELASAIETIREIAERVKVQVDRRFMKVVATNGKVASAKRDKPLQSFLKLVETSPLVDGDLAV